MQVELQHSFFSPIRSGQERRIHLLARELLRKGVVVSVCASSEGLDDPRAYEAIGIRFFIHPPYFSRAPRSLLDPVLYPRCVENFLKARERRWIPDLVLCFGTAYVVAAKRAWPRVRLGYLPGSTIWDWQSWLYGHRRRVARSFLLIKKLAGVYVERQAVNLADRLYMESRMLINRFERFHPGVQGKVAVFRTPVDTGRFFPSPSRRAEVRNELRIPANTRLILAAGRLQWNKNFATLIRAAGLLRAKNWLLVIVGEGPDGKRLEALARRLGITEQVRFIGSRSDMERIYAGADVFAHAALMEPYGNVVLEAMASGLPSVVSPGDYVGISDELTDGITVLLADPKDPRDWVAKIDRLLADQQLATKICAEARAFCEQRAQWGEITDWLLSEFGLPCSGIAVA